MEHIEADKAVQQLVIAFSTLQDEYRGLHAQHQALERKLATAREQVRRSITPMTRREPRALSYDEQPLALDLQPPHGGVDRRFKLTLIPDTFPLDT